MLIFTRKPPHRRANVSRHPLISVIQQADPLVLVFVSSAFPDNFDDPEFIAETGKENKSEEKTRNPMEKGAGSTEAAVCYSILTLRCSKLS